MYAFVAPTRPRSVQARKTAHYKDEVVRAFQRYVPAAEYLDGPLYGVVYYFHNVKTDTDADNISKPVWDCLEGLAFANDRTSSSGSQGCTTLRPPGSRRWTSAGFPRNWCLICTISSSPRTMSCTSR